MDLFRGYVQGKDSFFSFYKPIRCLCLICNSFSRGRLSMVSAFWGIIIVLSKFVQLGDTIFIVLLKKRLHFFHV